ncbi:epiphycan [Vipera latastei]
MSSVTYVSKTYEIAFEDLDNLYEHAGELYIDQTQIVTLGSDLGFHHIPFFIVCTVLVKIFRMAVPTCILCTCLGTSVYCDDCDLEILPSLLKQTTLFYAHYNRMKKIKRNAFAHLDNLKEINLTSNFISEVDEDIFRNLLQLQELILRDNKIRQLPELPTTLTFIDVSNNRLGRKGIKPESFKDMIDLHHLYITSNNLDLLSKIQTLNNNILEMHEGTFCKINDHTYIRKPLEDIRLDDNPINLSKTPYA